MNPSQDMHLTPEARAAAVATLHQGRAAEEAMERARSEQELAAAVEQERVRQTVESRPHGSPDPIPVESTDGRATEVYETPVGLHVEIPAPKARGKARTRTINGVLAAVFEPPPVKPTQKRYSKWGRLFVAARERPGQWARTPFDLSQNYGATMASTIRRKGAVDGEARPGERWDAVVGEKDGKHYVWVRLIAGGAD